jgi:Methyltransferase domain
VSNEGTETVRISAEYQRRASELLTDFYAWMRPSNLMLHEHALRACFPMLGSGSQFPLGGRRIADIGCGDGGCCLSSFSGERMPRISAESTSARTVLEARAGGSPQADLRSGSASKLPWPHRSFDLVSQFTVFTSILDPELKRAVAAENAARAQAGWDDPGSTSAATIRRIRGCAAFPRARSVRCLPGATSH